VAPFFRAFADLPSTRLFRMAELAASALHEADPSRAAGPPIPEQALADVLAAVDASTAANTKAAYRSDLVPGGAEAVGGLADQRDAWRGVAGGPEVPAADSVESNLSTGDSDLVQVRGRGLDR